MNYVGILRSSRSMNRQLSVVICGAARKFAVMNDVDIFRVSGHFLMISRVAETNDVGYFVVVEKMSWQMKCCALQGYAEVRRDGRCGFSRV